MRDLNKQSDKPGELKDILAASRYNPRGEHLRKESDKLVVRPIKRPPPEHLVIVRPDRQITYPGIPSDQFPKLELDENTTVMTVLSNEPFHHFLIKVGDTVKVSHGRTFNIDYSYDVAHVTGINKEPRFHEIDVAFDDGTVASFCISKIGPHPQIH